MKFIRNSNFSKQFINPDFLFILLTIIIFILYSYVAYNSFGFPDEFWTIRYVEKYLGDWNGFLNYQFEKDVHPPLSYLIVFSLFKLFGSWKLLRIVISSTLVLSIINFSNFVGSRYGKFHGLTCLFFLAFDPAVLMWCTSVRWYSFYMIFLLWFLVIPKNKNIWFAIKFIIGFTLLGYTGYVTIILALPLIIYYYKGSLYTLENKLKLLVAPLFIFLLIYYNQLEIFFSKKVIIGLQQSSLSLINQNSYNKYIYFFINNIKAITTAVFSNQGIMPYSILGVSSIISLTFISFFAFKELFKRDYFINNFSIYLLSILLFVFSGLSVKFRNFLLLAPLRSNWIASQKINSFKYFLPLIIIAIAQLKGVSNIVNNSGTTKSFFNVPFHSIVKDIEIFSESCNTQPIVFHHEKTLNYYLNKKGYLSISDADFKIRDFEASEYNLKQEQRKKEFERKLILPSENCVVVIDTFRGFSGISKYRKDMMIKALKDLSFSEKSIKRIGKNKDIFFSRIIRPDYPRDSAIIYKLKNVKDLNKMRIWYMDNK